MSETRKSRSGLRGSFRWPKRPKKPPVEEIKHPVEGENHSNTPFSNYDNNTLKRMSDEEIDEKFKELLERKGIDYDNFKHYDRAKKIAMLLGDAIEPGTTKKFQNPQEYISYLGRKDLKNYKTLNCIRSLRIELANNSVNWIQEFGHVGIDQILLMLRKSWNGENKEDVLIECIKCLRAIMNSKDGLKLIFNHKDSHKSILREDPLKIVAETLNPRYPSAMAESANLLAACCLIPLNGHQKILEAISLASESSYLGKIQTGSEKRFYSIINGFFLNARKKKGGNNSENNLTVKRLSMEDNYKLKTSCLTLTNAIISSPRSLDFRMHLRNEFIRQGIDLAVEKLRNNPTDDLQNQINIFDNDKKEDHEEFIERFNNIRIDFNSLDDCFKMLKDNASLCPIEEQLFLSILQHLLCLRKDSNVRPAYFELIESSISQIVLNESGEDPDFRSKQRFELNVQTIVKDLIELRKLKQELGQIQGCKEPCRESNTEQKIDNNTEETCTDKEQAKRDDSTDTSLIPPIDNNKLPTPSQEQQPPTSQGKPPPPPPPPLSLLQPALNPGVKLPNRKEWRKSNTKKILWKPVDQFKLTPNTFWLKVEEDKLLTKNLVKQIEINFKIDELKPSTPMLPHPDRPLTRPPSTRTQPTRTVDSAKERALLIALKTYARNLSRECIKKSVLECNTKVVTEQFLTTLISNLPDNETVKSSIKTEEFDDLSEVDKFIFTMSDIERLIPRLRCLLFSHKYPQLIAESKYALKIATKACKDVRQSKKFRKLLEYILLVGNIMNSGSPRQKAVGFDISFLKKLESIKDPKSKISVLDFIVSNVREHLNDLQDFHFEIESVDKASRIDTGHIKKCLAEMRSDVDMIQKELENCSNGYTVNKDDRFIEYMTPFIKEAETDLNKTKKLFDEMESLYEDLGTYFCFDKKQYQLDAFMKDIKTFKEQFMASQCSMINLQQAEPSICKSNIELLTRRQSRLSIDMPEENIIDRLLNSIQKRRPFLQPMHSFESYSGFGAITEE